MRQSFDTDFIEPNSSADVMHPDFVIKTAFPYKNNREYDVVNLPPFLHGWLLINFPNRSNLHLCLLPSNCFLTIIT